MAQIPEPECRASQVLEAAVDRLRRSVACSGSVEVGEHISSSAFQGSPERRQLRQRCRHSCRETRDDRPQSVSAASTVGVAVRGHDALVDPPRHVHLGVFLGSEHPFEPVRLFAGEQVRAREQDATDAIERVPGPAPVPECLLLDPLPTPLYSTTSQSHDVERIHHRDGVRQLFGRG